MFASLCAFLNRILHLPLRAGSEATLDDELQFHLQMEIESNVRQGMTEDEARRRALLSLGGLEQTREACRDAWAIRWAAESWQDVRHACRLLRRNPGFTLVACLTLALGIGATTIIFSVIDAALFRPLPYMHADRLVELSVQVETRDGHTTFIPAAGTAAEQYRAVRQVFDAVEAFGGSEPKPLATGSDLAPLVGVLSPSFTTLLGISPQLGRAFIQDDIRAADAILISDSYWHRVFNRDREVIGKSISFADRACVVIGVMPPTFRYFVGATTDAWLPIAERDGTRLAARLRPGLSVEQAQRELNVALARTGRLTHRAELSLAGWDRGAGFERGGGRGYTTRTMLFSLLGAVGLVLLTACANVASLLLSRAVGRQHEVAIRSAMGATRVRVARQFLVEGVVLAGLGGAAASGLAWWGIRAIPAAVPTDLVNTILGASLPRLDARVLTFGVASAILTGLLCAVVPAVRASRPTMDGLLSSGHSIAGLSRSTRRAQGMFQALQVATTLVLLSGAALTLTSVVRMVNVPRAFDATNLGYAVMDLPRTGYDQPAQQLAFFDELVARTVATSGVHAATAGSPPVSGIPRKFMLEGSGGSEPVAAASEVFMVQRDYFRVVRLPLLEGRVFGPEDGPNSPAVAIISSNAARRFWPGQSAIGKHFKLWDGLPMLTVVGVVPHTRTVNLTRDGVEAYVPVAQSGWPTALVFRTNGDPASVIASIRASIRDIDPRVTLRRIGSVEKLYAEFDPLGSPQFYAWLLGLFAGVALVTAAVGLYGLLSYSVGRRTREIGVRIALGADLARVRWLVVRDAMRPIAAGILAGLLASRWLSRFIASQLFQVQADDPLILAAIVLLLLIVSAAAALEPVTRASRVNPIETLRAD